MSNLKSLQQLFINYLQKEAWDKEPNGLYAPIDYIMNLGGKRIRPVLTLMAYDIYKQDVKAALPIAYCIELFHNFTLVHDDIMDEAPLRRGEATVHKKWNESTGILSGDVMLIYVYEYLRSIEDAEQFKKAVAIFNKTAIEVCEGQQMDMDFEKRDDVTVEEYIEMIRLKTSVLLGGALYLGGLIAGAPTDDLEKLFDYGVNVGIAFQIQDDWLDTYGASAKVGKRIGGDILQNKKTILYLKALAMADEDQKVALNEWFSTTNPENEDHKIQSVKQLFNEIGLAEPIAQLKAAYQAKGLAALSALNVSEEKKSALNELAAYLLNRKE